MLQYSFVLILSVQAWGEDAGQPVHRPQEEPGRRPGVGGEVDSGPTM